MSQTIRTTPQYVEALRAARATTNAQLMERITLRRELEADLKASRQPICQHYVRGALQAINMGIRRLQHELGAVERTLQLARVS